LRAISQINYICVTVEHYFQELLELLLIFFPCPVSSLGVSSVDPHGVKYACIEKKLSTSLEVFVIVFNTNKLKIFVFTGKYFQKIFVSVKKFQIFRGGYQQMASFILYLSCVSYYE